MKTLAEARSAVDAQMDSLRHSVFQNPPSDWAGFQLMLGKYMALDHMAAVMSETKIEGDEK